MNDLVNLIWVVNTPQFGGLEKFTVNLLANLPADRFRNTLLVSARSQLAETVRHQHPAVALHAVDFPRKMGRWKGLELFFPFRIIRLKSLLRNRIAAVITPGQPAIVIFQTFLEKLFGTPIARQLQCHVVWIEHGPLPGWFKLNPALSFLYRIRANLARALICVSPAVAQSLAAIRITRELTVIPNAVPPQPTFKRNLPAKFRIGYIGRLERGKGIETILALAGTIDPGRYEIVIRGGGTLYANVRRQITRLRLPIQLSPFSETIDDLLSTLHVLLYPSTASGEGLPLIILEALNHGIPVICHPVGGIGTAIQNNSNGIVLGDARPITVLRAIDTIAADYTRFSSAALTTASQRFDFQRLLDSYQSVFTETIRCPSPQRIMYISAESDCANGGGVHTLEMAIALCRRAQHVNLVVDRSFAPPPDFTFPDNLLLSKIPLKLFGKTLLPIGLLFGWRLLKSSPDLMLERYYCTGSLARGLSWFSGVPFYLESNHPHHLEMVSRYPLLSQFFRHHGAAITRAAAGIITPTKNLIPAGGHDKCLVLRWGVNRQRFSRITENNYEVSPKNIIYTGAFAPWHGRGLLIETMRLTLKHTANAQYTILCSAENQRAGLRAELDRDGISSRVAIHHGIPFTQVPSFLARACIGIAPYLPAAHPWYRVTGFYWTPFKILEYLASGIPVVTTDDPYLVELVAGNGFGICCPPDSRALAAAVERLLNDRAAWLACHRAILQRFDDRYSWDHFVGQFVNYLQTTAQSRD